MVQTHGGDNIGYVVATALFTMQPQGHEGGRRRHPIYLLLSNPKTATPVVVPTYTLPLTIAGVPKWLALPN